MRENRMYGSEGGGDELNRPFLPLSSEASSTPSVNFVARLRRGQTS